MAPSIRYMNQSAPFWDWIANFEDQAAEHPWFNTNNTNNGPPDAGSRGGPWGRHGGWGGPRGHPHHHQHHHGAAPPPPGGEAEAHAAAGHDDDANATRDTPMTSGDENAPDPPEEAPSHPPHEGRHSGRGGRRCGGRRGGPRGWGPPPPHHGGPGGSRGHHGRGPWGLPPHMRGGGMPGGFGFLSDLFAPQSGGEEESEESNDWKPEADVFDTKEGYVIHLSLPGAHKEDVGVSWDPEKSELSVAGVVHRPGDEEFLKSLALDERRVGMFDRKIRLGTRASPAQVDVDGITAKLENGILIVDVPKLMGDFVDIKKVEIE